MSNPEPEGAGPALAIMLIDRKPGTGSTGDARGGVREADHHK